MCAILIYGLLWVLISNSISLLTQPFFCLCFYQTYVRNSLPPKRRSIIAHLRLLVRRRSRPQSCVAPQAQLARPLYVCAIPLNEHVCMCNGVRVCAHLARQRWVTRAARNASPMRMCNLSLFPCICAYVCPLPAVQQEHRAAAERFRWRCLLVACVCIFILDI